MPSELPIYQVDAFASKVFAGNPAAVCPLESWLPDELLQAIAAENNLSETAYLVKVGSDYRLRWFTPALEVDLCGHATLASGYVIMTHLEPRRERVRFHTRSGPLEVARQGDLLTMDFPAAEAKPYEGLDALAAALGARPMQALIATKAMAVFEREADVAALAPNMERVAALDCDGVIATAPGDNCDFVSRYFAPAAGIPEDLVTGSAHCILTPYWAKRLGKQSLQALQISRRGGELLVEHRGERVAIAGRVAPYMVGRIAV